MLDHCGAGLSKQHTTGFIFCHGIQTLHNQTLVSATLDKQKQSCQPLNLKYCHTVCKLCPLKYEKLQNFTNAYFHAPNNSRSTTQ